MRNNSHFTYRAALVLSVFSIFLPVFSNAAAQGSLVPAGPPGPTMKSLDQIEPRKAISEAPFVITAPGSYYLTTNLTVNEGNGITISTSNVTLDLNGFTILSTAPVPSGRGVTIEHKLANIEIRNGFVQGGVTNNGSGVFSGPGFLAGISYLGWGPSNTRISGVKVSGCSLYGIYLDATQQTSVIESCTVSSVGDKGIAGGVVKDCVAVDCAGNAIEGRTVINSEGRSIGAGHGVHASQIAQNCVGSSNSGNGINGLTLVNGCTGYSNSGIGLVAENAVFSTGYRPGGAAIKATSATGCLPLFGTNNIMFKYNTP